MENNASRKVLRVGTSGITNILCKYLPKHLVLKEVIPFAVDFNEQLLTCIEMKSYCLDAEQSAQLTKSMNSIIAWGIDPNYNNGAPLTTAIFRGSAECANKLIELGADPNRHSDRIVLAALLSPFRAAMFRYLQLGPVGVPFPADCLFKPSLDDRTYALINAIKAKNRAAIAFMCQFDPTYVQNNLDTILASALMATCDLESIQFMLDMIGHRTTIELLLLSIVELEDLEMLKLCITGDKTGTTLNTVFKLAAIVGKANVVKLCINLLRQQKSDTNSSDIFYLALFNEKLECAQLIAENRSSDDKFRFLYTALETGDLDKVQCMVAAGADHTKFLQIKNLTIRRLVREHPQIFNFLGKQEGTGSE